MPGDDDLLAGRGDPGINFWIKGLEFKVAKTEIAGNIQKGFSFLDHMSFGQAHNGYRFRIRHVLRIGCG